jgi:hypothetical protein
MRYFLVSYTANVPNGWANGNLFFNNEGFPNNNWLRKKIVDFRKGEGLHDVVIQSIFEFQSKEDFDAFAASDDSVSPQS